MSGGAKLAFLREVMKIAGSSSNFSRVTQKMRVTEGDEGRCVAELDVAEEHENHGGSLHGGLTATLIDVVSTGAVMTMGDGMPGVSVDMNITYMNAGRHGETIVIDSKVLKFGRNLVFTTTDVFRKEDKSLIAQGRHTKYLPGAK